MSIDRRTLIKAGLALGTASMIPQRSHAAPLLVRYEASTPQGKAMLMKYAKAVALMKRKGAGDPCGWIFQWYTHAVKTNMAGMTLKPSEVAALPAAQQPLANAMWNTCQNHFGATSEDMFLPWHRMFVYFFERIVRTTIGDPTFTLPYWNYNQPATAALPAPFITPGTAGNPLWATARNPGPNGGAPLTGLDLSALMQTTYSGFSSALDFGLHGNVHVKIGNAVGMGAVPWAAADPIFWMHHCNIDRLWASWNAAGNANPTTPAWLGQTFTFADERCKRVAPAVGRFPATPPLGYVYDRLEPRPLRKITWPLPRPGLPGILQGPGPIELTQRVTTVDLAPATTGGPTLTDVLGRRSVYLVLDRFDAALAPGVTYTVYLNLPDGATDADRGGFAVGTINFFAAVRMPGMDGMPAPTVSLEVTTLLRDLQRRNAVGERVKVTLVADDEPRDGAKPTIASASLVEA